MNLLPDTNACVDLASKALDGDKMPPDALQQYIASALWTIAGQMSEAGRKAVPEELAQRASELSARLENEECARLCDQEADRHRGFATNAGDFSAEAFREIAKTIRKRVNP